MGPKTEELTEVLEELIAVLDEDNEEQWSAWMSQARKWILASDFSGVEKVLQAYGGMGSLNDLVLGYHYVDGQLQQKKGRGKLNDKLVLLRERAWKLANEIKREANT